MKSTKGKTYEQIYGSKKAKELRELRSNTAKKQMAVQRKGKTWEEVYGKVRATSMKSLCSVKRSGSNNWNYKDGAKVFTCLNCGKLIKTEKYFTKERAKKFCSTKCFSEFRNRKIKYSCIVCGKVFYRKKSWKNVKFCSRICMGKDWTLENNPNWQGGTSFEPYGLAWTKELREAIRKRDNYTCQKCGMTEIEHRIRYGRILTVHHIDYNKQNCKENNLTTACVKCNTSSNSNRDYWFAYFRYILDGE